MNIYLIIENDEGITQDPCFATFDSGEADERLTEMRINYILDNSNLTTVSLRQLHPETIRIIYEDLACCEGSYFALHTVEVDLPDESPTIEIDRTSYDEVNAPEKVEANGEMLPNLGHLIAHYVDLNYCREMIGIENFIHLIDRLRTAWNFGQVNTAFDKAGLQPPVVGDKVILRPKAY